MARTSARRSARAIAIRSNVAAGSVTTSSQLATTMRQPNRSSAAVRIRSCFHRPRAAPSAPAAPRPELDTHDRRREPTDRWPDTRQSRRRSVLPPWLVGATRRCFGAQQDPATSRASCSWVPISPVLVPCAQQTRGRGAAARDQLGEEWRHPKTRVRPATPRPARSPSAFDVQCAYDTVTDEIRTTDAGLDPRHDERRGHKGARAGITRRGRRCGGRVPRRGRWGRRS